MGGCEAYGDTLADSLVLVLLNTHLLEELVRSYDSLASNFLLIFYFLNLFLEIIAYRCQK